MLFSRDFKLVLDQLKLWMLTSQIGYLRENSIKGFGVLVQRNTKYLQTYFNRDYVTDIFTNEIYTKKLQVVRKYLLDVGS